MAEEWEGFKWNRWFKFCICTLLPTSAVSCPPRAPNVDVQHHSFLYLIICSGYWDCFEMGLHEVQPCVLPALPRLRAAKFNPSLDDVGNEDTLWGFCSTICNSKCQSLWSVSLICLIIVPKHTMSTINGEFVCDLLRGLVACFEFVSGCCSTKTRGQREKINVKKETFSQY